MLQKKTKIVAIIGGGFFLVSVLVLVTLAYLVSNQKAQFLEMRKSRIEAEQHQESLRTLMQTLENTADARATLASSILKEEEVINFLALIESIGKEQGVALTTNTLTIQPINQIFETLVVSLRVEGEYKRVIHTLKLLEYLPYQASIGKVQIGRIGDMYSNEWESTYEIHVTKFKKI